MASAISASSAASARSPAIAMAEKNRAPITKRRMTFGGVVPGVKVDGLTDVEGLRRERLLDRIQAPEPIRQIRVQTTKQPLGFGRVEPSHSARAIARKRRKADDRTSREALEVARARIVVVDVRRIEFDQIAAVGKAVA
jgi:hypothetical protein